MSVCYNINCHKCHEQLWVGQRNRIYTTDKAIESLRQFLFKHKDHDLQFNDDNSYFDYAEFNAE